MFQVTGGARGAAVEPVRTADRLVNQTTAELHFQRVQSPTGREVSAQRVLFT